MPRSPGAHRDGVDPGPENAPMGKETFMKKPLYLLSAAVLLVVAGSCSNAPKQNEASTANIKPADQGPIARGEAASLKVSFSVEAVDAEKRLITLKGPQGNEGVYEVGDEVKRLAEIKAGDKINAEYNVAAVAELREPTAEEKSAPLVAMQGGERGPSDAPPAAGIGRAVRAVATIEALDGAAQNVTVKGRLDGMVTVHVDDATVFSQLQVGQSVVVSFAETLVLSVEPGAKKH